MWALYLRLTSCGRCIWMALSLALCEILSNILASLAETVNTLSAFSISDSPSPARETRGDSVSLPVCFRMGLAAYFFTRLRRKSVGAWSQVLPRVLASELSLLLLLLLLATLLSDSWGGKHPGGESSELWAGFGGTWERRGKGKERRRRRRKWGGREREEGKGDGGMGGKGRSKYLKGGTVSSANTYCVFELLYIQLKHMAKDGTNHNYYSLSI